MLITEIHAAFANQFNMFYTIHKCEATMFKRLERLAPCKISETARNSLSQGSGPSKFALLNAPFCGDKVLTDAR